MTIYFFQNDDLLAVSLKPNIEMGLIEDIKIDKEVYLMIIIV